MASSRDFIPAKDADLLAWAQNDSSRITATPTAYGLTAAQATALASLVTSFTSALSTATNPATRTRGTVSAKNAAKAPMVAMARDLARIINAFPGITNQQRIDLGLTPRSGQITPINPPTESPVMEVVSAFGRLMKVKNDPRLVAAARELRDRWLERINADPSALLSNGKYEVCKALPSARSEAVTTIRALPGADSTSSPAAIAA
jgi:hypothetical protein